MGTIDDMKSILTQSALDALSEKFHIPCTIHLELPGRNQRIRNSPTGKIGVYTRFFVFANYRIPLSQFLVDILEYFQINLSQLSVIAAAKVSHFEILCRVHSFVPTVRNFRRFYINSKNKGWMSFSKRSDTAQFLESFLCLIGISRYYELDDNVHPVFLVDDDEEMDLFAFINHADPTKVRIGEREVREGEVPLLDSTRGRVVPLAGVNEQGNQNDDVEDDGNQNDDVQDARNNDEVPATVAEKAKGSRKKRKAFGGASGSSLPPKKLRASGPMGLLERITLPVEVGVTTVATLPFITSYVSLTSEREEGGRTDSVTGPNLRTQHPSERSLVSDPPIMTTVVATTAVANTSFVSVPRAGNEPVHHTLFADSASIGESNPDVAGPSHPAGTELSTDSFFVVDHLAL
ncbi:hypothetical protein Tco_0662981 [Tanacetum coccineum]